MKTTRTILAAGLLTLGGILNSSAAEGTLLSERVWHLGNDEVKTWPEAPVAPEGFALKLPFESKANKKEKTLSLLARNVDDTKWIVRLNGNEIGRLKKNSERALSYYRLPVGALLEGKNVLEVKIRKSSDDITVGEFVILDDSLRELLKLETVTVTVVEKSTGKHLPALVTVTDMKGNLVELFFAESERTAVRRGILYTLGEPAGMDLPAGDYKVSAMHGTEWGMDKSEFKVVKGQPQAIQLALSREVETDGFIAADTHIHTLTFSGHGDASVTERMVTLAAEGVELAVATDHNHQSDFRPYQKKLGLEGSFTSVIGNEVTSRNGHFCSFPFPEGNDIPKSDESDWVKLVEGIRAKGARVVILNHPRWPDIARGPFGKFGLNRASGERATGGAFQFDALELINSGTLQPDPFYITKDWFSLLNFGEKVTAVGSSDSHAVGKIVGQGRTYVRTPETDPSRIDVDKACDTFLAGDTTVSMGIVTDVTVNQRYRTGDTIVLKEEAIVVDLRVASPSWVNPKTAYLVLNGVIVAEKEITSGFPSAPTDLQINFNHAAPKHDAWMVCVIVGDGVKHPAWATEENYTYAATNPIYLNVDGNSRYDSPRKTALHLLDEAGEVTDAQWNLAVSQEDGIAIQMIAEMRHRTGEKGHGAFDKRVVKLSATRPAFAEYLRYLPKAKVAPKK
ncbi:CehA/McbA family metallohydrolase [Verrucomicrobia bacterium]|nr:CehA/McbA family metallohydrolase [Verrucomicrobiota bacterium]